MDRKPGDSVEFQVHRAGIRTKVVWNLRLATASNEPAGKAWRVLGLRLLPLAYYEVHRYDTKYRGGLRVTGVRAGSPAQRRGIQNGDILVGLHVWETITLDNVAFVLSRPELGQLSPIKFYVLRAGQTLYGYLEVAN